MFAKKDTRQEESTSHRRFVRGNLGGPFSGQGNSGGEAEPAGHGVACRLQARASLAPTTVTVTWGGINGAFVLFLWLRVQTFEWTPFEARY